MTPSTSPTSVNRGFTDHEMLDDQQLVNMNGRIYDPVIARFLSVDPIAGGGAQTYNAYSYVANNPVSAIDPSGFQTVDLISNSGGFNFNGVNFSNPGYTGGWNSSVGTGFSGGANITFSFTAKNGTGSAGGIAAAAQPGLRYLSSANGGALGYSTAAFGMGGFGPEAVLDRERANFWATARMSQIGLFDYQQSFNVLAPAAARGFWNSIRHLPDAFIAAVARQFVYANANPAQRDIMNKVMYYQLGSSLLTPERRAEAIYGPMLLPLLPKGLNVGRGMAAGFRMGLVENETAILMRLKIEAIARFEVEGLTPRQQRLLITDPGSFARSRGTQIDTFFKEAVDAHPDLQHLITTPRYKFGPDVFDPATQRWWDVTTPGKWDAHLQKYWLFGDGTPLFTH
jgi:RHS repeat-associated protein